MTAPAAEVGLPIPPSPLRVRVSGVPSEAIFRTLGRQLSAEVRALLSAAGRPVEDPGVRILDFGCGCGRVMRFFAGAAAGAAELHGVDVDAEAIEWCTANLSDIASFATVDRQPPMPYPDGHFDAIFAISVFTHLPEDDQLRWLSEFHRVLRPNGVLLLTVLGRTALRLAGPELATRVTESGIVYLDDGGTEGLPDWYQSCFHTEEYVRRAWTERFAVRVYLDAAVGHSQDVVVLRPAAGVRE